MTEEQPKYVRNKKTYGTSIVRDNRKNKLNDFSNNIKKSPTLLSNDLPDTLKEDNSNAYKVEKLTNFRKPYKHMTQLPQQLDRPDVLLGLNEYKEIHPQNRFHTIKKLNSSSSIHDMPDTLDPIKDNQFSQMPRPESMSNIKRTMKEENKNAEIANLKLLELSKEKILSEIPENNNETDRVKSEDNNNINNNNKEETKEKEISQNSNNIINNDNKEEENSLDNSKKEPKKENMEEENEDEGSYSEESFLSDKDHNSKSENQKEEYKSLNNSEYNELYKKYLDLERKCYNLEKEKNEISMYIKKMYMGTKTNLKNIPNKEENINSVINLVNKELKDKDIIINELKKNSVMTDLSNIKSFSEEKLNEYKKFYTNNLIIINDALNGYFK